VVCHIKRIRRTQSFREKGTEENIRGEGGRGRERRLEKKLHSRTA
jgi:hypothetical protein